MFIKVETSKILSTFLLSIDNKKVESILEVSTLKILILLGF